MGAPANIVITNSTLSALAAIHRYRYLSVNQVATIIALKPKSVSELLLRLERQNFLSSFGNTGIRGYGKTPKVYYLTKSGHRLLAEESEAAGETVEPYRPINVSSRWSPIMFHRLDTLDVLASLERDCASLKSYRLVSTLVEYRREKRGSTTSAETMDFVSDKKTPENKIVPDAGFVIEHIASGKRALFLIEVDCGTERLTTGQSDAIPQTFSHKMAQYDCYLGSRNFTERYRHLGEFNSAMVLVITTNLNRVHNMRVALASRNADYHGFYRFSILDTVRDNFFHSSWVNRDCGSLESFSLVRGA